MAKKSYIVIIISFVLSGLALANSYGIYQAHGKFDVFYLLFGIIGLTGSILGILGKVYSRWLLFIFYGLQLIFVYGETFRFVMNPGLAFPFKILSGSVEEAFANPKGFAINILAIIMLILCFVLLRPTQKEKE